MNPQSMDDAKRLSETMRCLIAEWGAEHFQLNLPRKWEAYADNAFKRADFHYVTENSIVIKVGTGKDIFEREFKLSPSYTLGII